MDVKGNNVVSMGKRIAGNSYNIVEIPIIFNPLFKVIVNVFAVKVMQQIIAH